MRDPETGASKGFGFVSYDNFESSDAAMNAMNGKSPLSAFIINPFKSKANFSQIKLSMCHTLIKRIQKEKDTEAQLVILL